MGQQLPLTGSGLQVESTLGKHFWFKRTSSGLFSSSSRLVCSSKFTMALRQSSAAHSRSRSPKREPRNPESPELKTETRVGEDLVAKVRDLVLEPLLPDSQEQTPLGDVDPLEYWILFNLQTNMALSGRSLGEQADAVVEMREHFKKINSERSDVVGEKTDPQ